MAKGALQQLDFTVKMGDKRHTFSLVPMKKKTAVNVFHNVLSSLLEAIAGAIGSGTGEEDVIAEILSGLKGLTFDQFWFIAERVFRFAIVDGVESQNLEDAEWWAENPLLLYKATYEGLKRNYPDVFLSLGLDDLLHKSVAEKDKTSGDTEEKK